MCVLMEKGLKGKRVNAHLPGSFSLKISSSSNFLKKTLLFDKFLCDFHTMRKMK